MPLLHKRTRGRRNPPKAAKPQSATDVRRRRRIYTHPAGGKGGGLLVVKEMVHQNARYRETHSGHVLCAREDEEKEEVW